jgi:DNA polymerase I
VRFGARLPKRLLIGVDAESIQLRIFAHLINEPDLINAIVNGKKSDKTDPHNFNKTVFGPCCKTRQAAKHSLYAVFFGGGPGKIAEIMGCSREEAKEAIHRLVTRYSGLAHLEREVFPGDAKRGWFKGLDGRKVRIPGDTVGERKHLCMSGYLQCGEAVVMKLATLKFEPRLKQYNALLVNLVHDEWQVECPNDIKIAVAIAQDMCDSLRQVGKELKLNCPLAGSYYNDDLKDYTIGTNWKVTH